MSSRRLASCRSFGGSRSSTSGGDPDRHDVLVLNRLTAALFATHLELVPPGTVVLGVSARFFPARERRHPARVPPDRGLRTARREAPAVAIDDSLTGLADLIGKPSRIREPLYEGVSRTTAAR